MEFLKTSLGKYAAFSLLALAAACSSNSDSSSETGQFHVSISSLGIPGEKNQPPYAYIGESLPIHVQIQAPDTIKEVGLVLRLKQDDSPRIVKAEQMEAGIVGKTNSEFAVEFELPDTLDVGLYEVDLIVSDRKGTQGKATYPIQLMIDAKRPVIAELEAGLNAAGDDLHLAASIAAPDKIAKILAQLNNGDWAQEFVYDKESLVGKIDVHFHEHAHLHDAPSGEYTLTLVVIDQAGRRSSSSTRFSKK